MIAPLRPKRKGPFGKEELGLIKVLMPHLQRAFQLHERIAGLEKQVDSLEQALDRLPIGFLLIDDSGKALMVNQQAQMILDQNDGLQLTRDGLAACRAAETNRLRGFVQTAIAAADGRTLQSGGTILLTRPSLRRPFEVLITPMRAPTTGRWPSKPAAAIFVSDPEKQPETPAAILARLFGLTPAEARLAALLMQGKSIDQAAEQSGVTRSTIRTQLQQVFEKTATTRQGELVALLWNSPARIKLE